MKKTETLPEPIEIACHYCDELHFVRSLKPFQEAHCRQCGAPLYHGKVNLLHAYIYAITGLIAFICANTLPFLSMNIAGEESTTSIITSIGTLAKHDLYLLTIFVFLLIIVFPALYLISIIWVIHRARRGRISSFSSMTRLLTSWNMIEVYMIGVLVSLVKLYDIGEVTIEPGFWFFGLLIFTSIASAIRFDLPELVQQVRLGLIQKTESP